jgi:hypothetical protein
MNAIPIPRGCGTSRISGGVYFELGLSPNGIPLDAFLIDPPLECTTKIPARGVLAIERDGVTHIVDRVGNQFYANVLDFWEEVRRFGLSRRISRNFPFEKLTSESRILLVHDKALIANPKVFWKAIEKRGDKFVCPKAMLPGEKAHEPGESCAGYWSSDLDPKTLENGVRTMPSFKYNGRPTPEGIKVERKMAFFASLPCTRLVVVNGDGADASFEKASKAKLVVEREDQ